MELQRSYEALQDAGAEVVAIAAVSPNTVSSWSQNAAAQYPVLSDAGHAVSSAYGVYDLVGDGGAGPAVFIVGQDGRVVWRHLGQSAGEWVDGATILAHLP